MQRNESRHPGLLRELEGNTYVFLKTLTSGGCCVQLLQSHWPRAPRSSTSLSSEADESQETSNKQLLKDF